jgi:hypothetical protein
MIDLTPADMRSIDIAHAAITAIAGLPFVGLLLATFIDNGRLVAALIGA